MKRACFTLIELLVVIAMMTILLTISSFIFHSVRGHANAITCIANIRQVTLDLIMYDTDHKTFPFGFLDSLDSPPGGFIGDATKDRQAWWWFHFMEGYTDTKEKNLHCPSKSLNNPNLTNNILYGNYGVNHSICKGPQRIQSQTEFIGMPLSQDEIPQPERTLLIVDCGYSLTSWWHATDIPPVALDGTRGKGTAYIPGLAINNDKHLLPGQENDAIHGRHPSKKVSVGFVGGNVSCLEADDLFVEKRLTDYDNKIPIWTPE